MEETLPEKQEHPEEEHIVGTVDTIVFHNPENGYSVLRLAAYQPRREDVTVVGCVPNVGLGEELSVIGSWVSHPQYGDQFVIRTMERFLPVDQRGIAEYLGSGMLRGVGPKLAARIAAKFGEETFRVLSGDPEALSTVKGLTLLRAKEICRQFSEMNEMRLLMDFLTENGLPISLTALLFRRLGSEAIDALAANPYLLCDVYYGVNFAVADRLARNLGLSRISAERCDAGVLYAMTYNLENGHTFIPSEKLVAAALALLADRETELDESFVWGSIDRLEASGQIVREHICKRDAVYLRPLHDAEDYLAETLRGMAQREVEYDFDVDELLLALENDGGMEYAPLQRKAIAAAAKCGVTILTGGPGTGKTTTVRGMLRVFEALGQEAVLAAPTGRAAKRRSKPGGTGAKTIHRLLEAGYGAGGKLYFKKCATDPLDCDVVVVDEVSMVDVVLMQALLEAIPFGARLVLVGDPDQLPPVGPGNFLRDLIGSGRCPVIALTEIFRQALESDIVGNAHAINEGKLPTPSGRDGDFFILHRSDPADVIQTVVSLCRERLPKYYGIASGQIQVLTPSKRQGAGTFALNRALQEALNPPDPARKAEIRFGDTIFREGDRVMQVRNNYDIGWETEDGEEAGTGIFNGDVGEIVTIKPGQEWLIVRFDDKVATYTFDMLKELELAYAMTVHKAQGSEFDAVVVALSSGITDRLLTRPILYTAITRARRLLVIVGAENSIRTMVSANVRNRRYSALRARLRREENA